VHAAIDLLLVEDESVATLGAQARCQDATPSHTRTATVDVMLCARRKGSEASGDLFEGVAKTRGEV
jgi:hypothetical protein